MSNTDIQRLPEQFSKNGLPYKLIQRNEFAALYSVGGTYYPNDLHFEVVKIQHLPEQELFGKTLSAREVIPGNENFGKEGSKCITDRDSAEAYFYKLTEKLKIAKEAQNNT